MRGTNEHLSFQELEKLTSADADAAVDGLEDAMRHLESCDDCRYRLLGLEPSDKSPVAKSGPTPDCPDKDLWLDMAAGLLALSDSRRLLKHAVDCGHCGRLLKVAIEDLALEFTPEEEEQLKLLEISKPEWREEQIRKIKAVNPEPVALAGRAPALAEETVESGRKLKFLLKPIRWAWAAAAAIAVAAGSWGWIVLNTPSVEQVIAEASAKKRMTESRIPGARFAEFKVNLGSAPSERALTTSLGDAKQVIRHHLDATPRDARWLDLQGRAELVEGHPDLALEDLRRAREADPNSSEILTDLAIAYAERARPELEGSKQDNQDAYNLLSTVLERRPGDRVALFNRAIVKERLGLNGSALEDWDLYLKIDSSSDWAPEAKRRRDAVQKKLDAQKSAVWEINRGPAAFLALADSHSPEILTRIDQRAEDYQDVALRDWLPAMLTGERGTDGKSVERRALDRLADLLADRHGDGWLRDLLRQSGTAGFAAGIRSLADAFALRGGSDAALESSCHATDIFKTAGSVAGRLRAQVEEVHLLRRLQRPDECVKAANALRPDLARTDYRWMQAQAAIDQASCTLMQGKFDRADGFLESARQFARSGAYRNLQLRITGISAAVKSNEGYLTAAWTEDHAGLEQYWENGYTSPARAQQFYDDLSYLAERLNDWHSAVAFAKESARMLSLTGERENEGMARRHLAELAIHAGDPSLASTELELSKNLLKSSGREAAEEGNVFTETLTAEIEILRGDLQGARQRLEKIAPLAGSQTFTVANRFYQIYGQLLMDLHRESDAEQVLLHGSDIADVNRSNIADPEKRYSWSQENGDTYRMIASLEMLKGDNDRALAAWEWFKAAELPAGSRLEAKKLSEFWSGEKLRSLFPALAGQSVIVYAMLKDELAVWVVTENGATAQRVKVDAADLSRLSSRFIELCGNADSDLKELDDTGHRLFQLLVAPVAPSLSPDRTLVIEPDEIFSNLPFQALRDDKHHYLGEDYRIGWSTGLLNTHHLRPSARLLASSPALIVGSSAIMLSKDTKLQPIPDLPETVEETGAHFQRPRTLLGKQATVVALNSALAEAVVAHLIGHAISGLNHEGLLLYSGDPGDEAGSALWSARQAASHEFQRSQLIVLAACSTGRATKGSQGSRAELPHDILLAGVPHVVASRWDVDSVATRRFMNIFYSRLLAGEPVTAALQAAEASLRSAPETQHPFYWAAFAAFGRA